MLRNCKILISFYDFVFTSYAYRFRTVVEQAKIATKVILRTADCDFNNTL